MHPIETLIDFLEPINLVELSNDEGYKHTQLGNHVLVNYNEFPDLREVDMVLVGFGECRGLGPAKSNNTGPDAIRQQLYSLFYWHNDVQVIDAGNVKIGATLQDSYAALKTVVSELLRHTGKVVILGGSHDLTLAQYGAHASLDEVIEAVCIDARIDLDMESVQPADQFLMEMLTGEPNYIKHYNHIGFQSYFVHPGMLETIDRLRFDCYRVGRVKEKIDEMEPVIRNANLFSLDIAAIQNSHAPANRLTPNGFNGEEICTLMQYAGMSSNITSIGIYGYLPQYDVHDLTAKQIAHMLWYLLDGIYKGKSEALLADRDCFNEFRMAFAEVETTFLQSKKTGRWWMEVGDGKYTACSHLDYLAAASNEIPERWMRAMERV